MPVGPAVGVKPGVTVSVGAMMIDGPRSIDVPGVGVGRTVGPPAVPFTGGVGPGVGVTMSVSFPGFNVTEGVASGGTDVSFAPGGGVVIGGTEVVELLPGSGIGVMVGVGSEGGVVTLSVPFAGGGGVMVGVSPGGVVVIVGV